MSLISYIPSYHYCCCCRFFRAPHANLCALWNPGSLIFPLFFAFSLYFLSGAHSWRSCWDAEMIVDFMLRALLTLFLFLYVSRFFLIAFISVCYLAIFGSPSCLLCLSLIVVWYVLLISHCTRTRYKICLVCPRRSLGQCLLLGRGTDCRCPPVLFYFIPIVNFLLALISFIFMYCLRIFYPHHVSCCLSLIFI